jgi:Uma2 family endonuclease
MGEYTANGVRLGWLIDPYARRVEVYRPGQEPEVVDDPSTLGADPELPGFVLDLTRIW